MTTTAIENLINENPEISITLKGGDLLGLVESASDRTLKKFLEKNDEKVYTRNDVIEKFDISPATLWRWEKMRLIQCRKIGKRNYYPESEIKRVLSIKGGE
ncbi:MAG: hypothetical protein JXA77_01205 [Bacteroidales bacterium]|nr:hypothetical protein [Bacteroidales bacterium]